MLRELDRLDSRVLRGRPDDDAGALERLDVLRVEAVAAPWKPSNGSVPQISAKRVPGTGVTVRTSPYRVHASRVTTGAVASGSLSSCAAEAIPARLRASSTSACWNPPQVPRKGTSSSRQWRIAANARSALRYGVPGRSQTPEASERSRASSLSVATQCASAEAGKSSSAASISRWVR